MAFVNCIHWQPIETYRSVRAESCTDCAELEALRDLEATARALRVKGYAGLFDSELDALDDIRAKRSGWEPSEARAGGGR
jgi:hypothetical protein